MSNWYIGQRIVAIKGLKQRPCGCNGLLIDIGYKALSATDSCCYCPDRRRNLDGVWWYSDAMFAPLDELEQAISELLEETDVVVK